MNRKLVITLAGLAALALPGCSSSRSAVAAVPGSSTPAAATPAGPGPGDVPVTQTVREGQPFQVTYQYSTGGSATWKITLDRVTCGSGTIFDPKIIAAEDESTGETPVTPRPHPGNKFCLVKFSDTNESHSNQNWQASLEATVNVGMNAYQDNAVQDGTGTGTGWDAQQAYLNYAQPSGQDSDSGFNPGVSGASWAVFEIPAAAKVTSVSVSASAYSGTSQVLIQVAG
jgi:hypothetical protein